MISEKGDPEENLDPDPTQSQWGTADYCRMYGRGLVGHLVGEFLVSQAKLSMSGALVDQHDLCPVSSAAGDKASQVAGCGGQGWEVGI